jgi:hypothetical protein
MNIQLILVHIALYNHPMTWMTNFDSRKTYALLYNYIQALTINCISIEQDAIS